MGNSYDVGYGKPPAGNRFRKGRSGNPRGRPKGTRNLKTDLLDEFAEQILIREGDQSRKVSKQRALLKSLTAKALKGDARAATVLLNMMWRIVEKEPPAAPPVDLSAEDQAVLAEFMRRQLSYSPPEDANEPAE